MWECNETKCEGDDPIVGSYTSVGNKLDGCDGYEVPVLCRTRKNVQLLSKTQRLNEFQI